MISTAVFNYVNVLDKAADASWNRETLSKINKVNLSRLNAQTYTDAEGYSYREDGNNVDIDTENVELASEQIRYSALTDSMTQEFSRTKSVLN